MLVNSPLIRVEGYFRPRACRRRPRHGSIPEPGQRPGAVRRLPRIADLPDRVAGTGLPDRDGRAPVQVAHPPGRGRAADPRRDDLPPDRVLGLQMNAYGLDP